MKQFLRDRRGICTAAVALLAATMVFAVPKRTSSGISVSAAVDSVSLVMGDRTHIRVNIDMPESSTRDARIVDFPVIPAGTDYIPWNGVDLVAVDSASVVEDGKRHITYDFTVQAFDPGTVTIPPFAVLGEAGADTAFSNVITIKVNPVDVDSLETINPMESIVSPATKWYDYIPNWLLWILLALVIAAALAATAMFFIKSKKKEEIIRSAPIPPYDLAMSRLHTLRSRNLAESGHEKEYYTELVDILRQYLEGRFGINAMEMTSTQIVRALRSNPKTRMSADQVKSVLAIADFVKFAKVRPLPDDNVKAYTRALDFVEQTKPEPEPEPEAEEEKSQKSNKNNSK